MKFSHTFILVSFAALAGYVGRTIAEDLPPASSALGSGAPSSAPSPPPPAPSLSSSTDPVIETPTTLVIPPGRPEWVEAAPSETDGIARFAISSEPWHKKADARRKLDEALVAQANEYITEQLGSPLATQFIHYDARTIKQRWVKPENIYEEQITVSIGPMYQVHALLEFDPNFRDDLDAKWTHFRATSRLTQVGLFASAGLLLLASVFGYFRLDNATRGYYTGRLQFLTAAAILAVVGTGVVLARWITWL
jgi:hypothetical protein